MSTTSTTTGTRSPNDTPTLPALDLRHALATKGYAHIPSLLTPSELSTLRAAASSATTSARTGRWPHIRTVPKQFPPWPSSPPPSGIWGVQHLLHPDLPESPVFATSYFHPRILSSVCEILTCYPDDLVLELYNLLVRPDEDFELRWHRDDVPPTAGSAEEETILGRPMTHAQWNLALYDDESLYVVPGSQKRARTEKERVAEPYEKTLEGMEVVKMKAGDVVFYDNNILHCGRYEKDKERATLHGSMGITKGSKERATNVLQHGIGSWVAKCDFTSLQGQRGDRSMKDVAEGMRANLLGMGSGEDVGFSQGAEE